MAKPKDDPTTSINLLATRTDQFTSVTYNEIENLRNRVFRNGTMAIPALIRIQMLGILAHRDVALRAVSAACKLVTRRPQGAAWNEFRMQVVSAVGEAFNNIVLHSYEGRQDGVIEMQIKTRRDLISIELRDYGSSFDLTKVPTPDLDSMPESGLGVYINRAFMTISYQSGHPNVLTLTKTLHQDSSDSSQEADPSEGAP